MGVKRKASTTGDSLTDAKGKQQQEEKPSYITWEASRLDRYCSVEDGLVEQLTRLRNQENEITTGQENLSKDISKMLAEEETLLEKFRENQRQKKNIASRLQTLERRLTGLRPHIQEKETQLKCVRAKMKVSRQAMITSVQRKCVELRKAETKLEEDIKCLTRKEMMSCQDDLRRSRSDLETEREKLLCQICVVNTRDSVILPCMHFLYCGDCLQTHQKRSNKCPTCRGSITALLRCKLF